MSPDQPAAPGVAAATPPGVARAHWDEVHRRHDPEGRSWFQREPRLSLVLAERAGIGPGASAIDVGAGTSRFLERLRARGVTDLTALDISAEALAVLAARPGMAGTRLIRADVERWTPSRHHDLWHDRALVHFLTDPRARTAYTRALRAAVRPGGHAILAAFAPDGPERCSGLPVARYDAGSLAALAGPRFTLVEAAREEHRTPSGAIQPFTWVLVRRDRGTPEVA